MLRWIGKKLRDLTLRHEIITYTVEYLTHAPNSTPGSIAKFAHQMYTPSFGVHITRALVEKGFKEFERLAN